MKRLIALTLCIAILISVQSSVVLAASENKNIIENGDCEQAANIGWITEGAAIKMDTTNPYAGKSCLKVEKNAGDYFRGAYHELSLVKGETYDVSFCIRVESGPTTLNLIIKYYDTMQYQYLMRNVAIGDTWTVVKTTFTFNGLDDKGGAVDGRGYMLFQLGTGIPEAVYYIDDLAVIPKGNVEKPVEDTEFVWDEDPIEKAKPVSRKSFADVKGNWAEGIINTLGAENILYGYDDFNYSPNTRLTRAEFVAMIVRSMKISLNSYNDILKDVDREEWFADYIQTAYMLGIIDKRFMINNMFYPNEYITRRDAALIINAVGSIKNAPDIYSDIVFNDIDNTADWAKNDIIQAARRGLISGFENGSFRGEQSLTRAEAAMLIKNIVEISGRRFFFVDTQIGNDKNDGSFSNPVATLSAAQRLVRNHNKDMKGNIYVLMKGENYVKGGLTFDTNDSGTNGYNIIYTSAGTEKASISGGYHFNGEWELDNADKNIYRHYVGNRVSRQLFVNGIRATRARSEGGLTDCTNDSKIGHTTTDTFLADYRKITDLEMVYITTFTNNRCMVDSISVENGIATLSLSKSTLDIMGNKFCAPEYYENAYELIDSEGEWYIDTDKEYLYYKPRSNEDIQTADFVLPVEKKLVNVVGNIDDNNYLPVHNIKFINIGFKYSSWMFPTENRGYNNSQNNNYRNSGDFLVDGAVVVNDSCYIDFTNCIFTKLGTVALEIVGASKYCNISENEFYDTSANGIYIGEPYYYPNTSADYKNICNPKDEKYYLANINVKNNYIHHIGVDYKSASAIGGGFPKYSQFKHNEIFNVPYSGFHLCYGWSTPGITGLYGVQISDNYIHEAMNGGEKMNDGGAIYVLGPTSGTKDNPNLIKNNYIKKSTSFGVGIYTDEGSSNWRVSDNVIDQTFVEAHEYSLTAWRYTIRHNEYTNNYVTNPTLFINGVAFSADGLTDSEISDKAVSQDSKWSKINYVPDRNWNDEAQSIIDNSGLESHALEKFNTDFQNISLKTEYTAAVGDTITPEYSATGRKEIPCEIPSDKIVIENKTPELIDVMPDGTFRTKAHGTAKLVMNFLTGHNDMYESFEVKIYIDDNVSEIKLNSNILQIINGYSLPLSLNVKTVLGRNPEITNIKYTVDDDSVADVTEEEGTYTLNSKSIGDTTLHVSFYADGIPQQKDFEVQITDFASMNNDIKNLYDFDEVTDFNNWVAFEGSKNEKIDNGIRLYTPIGYAPYSAKKFGDELLNFNMTINTTDGDWPSISLRSSRLDKMYSSQNCYLLTFGNGTLGLQRFNNGDRTVIFGDKVNDAVPIAGPNVPVDFKYGHTYNVKIGAQNEADGVRILLYINGINVFSYLDSADNKILDPGYFGVYCRKGYIDLTNDLK